MTRFADALQLAATVRNLGARDAGLLRCIDVVAFAGREIELLGRCLPYDDGRHRAVIGPDASRHRAIALRLHFADGRTRVSPAAKLEPERRGGIVEVVFDASTATASWDFADDPAHQQMKSLAGVARQSQPTGSAASKHRELSADGATRAAAIDAARNFSSESDWLARYVASVAIGLPVGVGNNSARRGIRP